MNGGAISEIHPFDMKEGTDGHILHALKEAVENIPVGVTITDISGKIVYLNPAEAEMHGYRVNELRGAHSRDLSPPENRRPLRVEQLRSITKWQRERLRSRKDGTTFPAQLLSYVVKNPYGDPVGMVTICEDVSEQKKVQAAIEESQEQQKLIEELDAFAHTVAHDLKTPLTVLLGYVEYLRDHQDTISKQGHGSHLETILNNGHKMKSIIDEILLLASFRKTEIKMEPLDMSAIVRNVQQLVIPEDCNASLVVPEKWPSALGYPGWVERVWSNLISNAIKYGGHPANVTLGWQEEPDGMIRFSVQDNGPGLTKEKQERLFKEFSRLDRPTKNEEGHGLGLWIVYRVIQRLGGQVGVESNIGEGCTFFFTLPGEMKDER